MSLVYGSVCSGIEAASVAWHPLGWRAAFFSEIEPFPRAVLAHHYPDVPLHGDFTTINAGDYAAIDVLVGGTPCQSFSVAGLRGGMDDERGNLALEYLRLADRLRPSWLVWENVPGVLSSSGGRDFGAFLGGLAELGYGWAYRVLDAQYFGLAQRRKRVFVVGCAGDWRGAAAVLFERHSLSGHPAPRREARQVAPTIPARSLGGGGLGADFDCDGGLVQSVDLQNVATGEIAGTLDTGQARGNRGHGVLHAPELARCDATREGSSQDFETTTMVAHSLRAEGFDASEDGTGRGTPLVPVAYAVRTANTTANGHGVAQEVTHTLDRAQGQAIAFHPTQEPISSTDVCHALNANANATAAVAFDLAQVTSAANRTRVEPGLPASTLAKASRMHVAQPMAVRRLTPRECERLQGFPDDYTLVPHRGKPAADGPRYKALGNSMAVPVMRWIGQRIAAVHAMRQA
jgi:DNA (cytosine-5)-methyltransferase 1